MAVSNYCLTKSASKSSRGSGRADRQAGRQTDRQTDRQTNRQAERKKEKQKTQTRAQGYTGEMLLRQAGARWEAETEKLTAPGIPRRSPIQVLTRPDTALLPRSDEIGRAQCGMAVSNYCLTKSAS